MPSFTPKQKRQSSASCQNGGFYKSPAHGDKIDMHGASSSSVAIVWDTSCLSPAPAQVDIYLLSPEKTANLGQVTVWSNVPYFIGQFDVQLDSTLWNSTATVDLQLQIIQAGTPVFLSQMAAGPVFKVINASPSTASASTIAAQTVTASVSTTSNSISGIWHDYAANFAKHGLSGGRLAASIVLPILVAFFAIAGYVFFSRRREARKRAAWKEETDKHMSMVSTDWQSMSAAGGAAAVRGSFHTPRGSVHTQSMLAYDAAAAAATGGVTPSPLRAGFASEDISQLGPRARALSAAAADGRPLSSLINNNEKALPLPGAPGAAAPRTRSKSTAALDAVAPLFGARAKGHGRTISASAAFLAAPPSASPVRPPMPMPRAHTGTGQGADDARPRTLSTASNNPFAGAMAKRDSHSYSPSSASRGVAVAGMAFPTYTSPSTPVTDSVQPRARVDSEGRPLDNASRARVGSRVSFADVLNERQRTQSTLSKNRVLDKTAQGQDDYYGLEMQDALPALALMRTRSTEFGQEGVAFPSSDGGHVLGPRAQFMSAAFSAGSGSRGSGVGSYFGSAPVAEHGESPDDALRRIAAQRRDSVRGSEDSSSGGIFGSLKRGLDRLRK